MFAIGLSVTTLILTSKGFGVLDVLTIERATTIMKGYYASEILYISSLCFSKLSILVLFYNVVVLRTHRIFVFSFGLCIFAWAVASATAAAFQCDMPRPWEMMTLRCFNTVSVAQISESATSLTASANLLGCVLRNRYIHRAIYCHALYRPGCTSKSTHVKKACCCGLLRAPFTCSRSCSRPSCILLPGDATRKPRV